MKAYFSKNTDDWKTPKEILDPVLEQNFIDCFPFKANYDEFEKTYKNKKLWVNPPYSKLKKIPEWINRQYQNNNLVLLLIPARTDTIYFHKLLELNPAIIFIKGRLHFNESDSAPFPSILMLFTKQLPLLLQLRYVPFTQKELIGKLKGETLWKI